MSIKDQIFYIIIDIAHNHWCLIRCKDNAFILNNSDL